jgi:hypothetical protein
MKNLLRAYALLALLLVAKCGREPQTAQPYEDPADCRCRIVNGKRVCNSACD